MEEGIPFEEAAEELGLDPKLLRFGITAGVVPVMRFYWGGESDDMTFLRLSEETIVKLRSGELKLQKTYQVKITKLNGWTARISADNIEFQKLAYDVRMWIRTEKEEGKDCFFVELPLHTNLILSPETASILKRRWVKKQITATIIYYEDADVLDYIKLENIK